MNPQPEVDATVNMSPHTVNSSPDAVLHNVFLIFLLVSLYLNPGKLSHIYGEIPAQFANQTSMMHEFLMKHQCV